MWNVEYNTLKCFPGCPGHDLGSSHPFDWVHFKKKHSKKPGKVESVFDIAAICLIDLTSFTFERH